MDDLTVVRRTQIQLVAVLGDGPPRKRYPFARQRIGDLLIGKMPRLLRDHFPEDLLHSLLGVTGTARAGPLIELVKK